RRNAGGKKAANRKRDGILAALPAKASLIEALIAPLIHVDEEVRVSFPYIVLTIASNTRISRLTIKSQNAYWQVLSEPILSSLCQEN
ncbi:MAG TPA: hypothetical protein VFA15_07305, partial [Nitrososphaera sp.]|nr:hypothetical protein [Nitrososphaera sp.]